MGHNPPKPDDISNLKKMRDANRLIEASLDSLFTIDQEGILTDVNAAAEKAIGLSRETLIGTDFSVYFTDPQRAIEGYQRVFKEGQVIDYDLIIKNVDGSLTPVLYNASIYRDEQGDIGVFAAARDITSTLKIQNELLYMKENLELLVKQRTEELENAKLLLGSCMESQRNMIILAIDKNYDYLYFNHAHAEAMKIAYGKEVKPGLNLIEQITNPDDVTKSKKNYDLALSGVSHTTIEQYGDISISYYETYYNPIKNAKGEIIGCTAFARDITNRIERENTIRQQNNLFASLLKLLPVGVFMVDAKEGKPLVANEAAKKLLGRGILPDANEKNLAEVYHTRKLGSNHIYPADEMPITLGMKGEFSHIDDMEVIRPDGTKILLEVFGAPVTDEHGKTWASLVSFMDITERRKFEEELRYLSFNDPLTGLYNRRFFEAEMTRLDIKRNLPISIVMGDVNGLKLVNDTFGHGAGDELLTKVSNALRAGSRADDIIARYGGDEFIMILPKTTKQDANRLISRFKHLISIEKFSFANVSVSFGVETKTEESESMLDILKSTEDEMYQHKIYESSSMRSKTIDMIMTTLFEKNSREMLHSKRVSEICVIIAKKMRLNKEEIKKIRITGLMHDIGKIGINEKILNSSNILDDQEIMEIRKHCEIGSRILGASGEFSEISDVVLQHHERWDGKGYPRGLKGEAISLNARIVAIADTYDAMVSERAYRKAFSVEEAVAEIKRCAGTQFDPRVAKIFIDMSQDEIYSLYHNGVQTPRG